MQGCFKEIVIGAHHCTVRDKPWETRQHWSPTHSCLKVSIQWHKSFALGLQLRKGSIVKVRNLVTGGAGFLGSHLVDRLMQADEEVICLDNYFTGRKVNIHLDWSSQFRADPPRCYWTNQTRSRSNLASGLPSLTNPLSIQPRKDS